MPKKDRGPYELPDGFPALKPPPKNWSQALTLDEKIRRIESKSMPFLVAHENTNLLGMSTMVGRRRGIVLRRATTMEYLDWEAKVFPDYPSCVLPSIARGERLYYYEVTLGSQG